MQSSNDTLWAVIAGGTSGIGLVVAHRLMQDGFSAVVTGRDRDRGARVEQDLRSAYPSRAAVFVQLDSGDFGSYGRLKEALGGQKAAAVVVSAAFGVQARILDTDPAVFMDMLKINVAAPLRLIQSLEPVLTGDASVVLISSDAGVDGEQALGAYSVTKAAVNMLGRMLALDLAPRGVRVNVVCPGDTVPGMRYLLRPGETERRPDDYVAWPVPPLGRLGDAQDTAEMVSFLVSSRAAFVAGSGFLVAGGVAGGGPVSAGFSRIKGSLVRVGGAPPPPPPPSPGSGAGLSTRGSSAPHPFALAGRFVCC